MYKVLRSYTRKAERKHEQSGGGGPASEAASQHHLSRSAPYVTSAPSSVRNGGSHYASQHNDSYQQHGHTGHSGHHSESYYKNGHVTPSGNDPHHYRQYDSSLSRDGVYQGRQGFSESSSYEAREHYERKVQKSKKTRGERERRRVANGNGSGLNEIKRVCFIPLRKVAVLLLQFIKFLKQLIQLLKYELTFNIKYFIKKFSL